MIKTQKKQIQKEEYKEEYKEEPTIIKQKVVKEKKQIKKVIEKPTMIDQEEFVEEFIPVKTTEKLITLDTAGDQTGRYTIKILSKITVEKKKRDFTRNVILDGNLEEDDRISPFTLSIEQDYIPFTDEIIITIDDVTKKDINMQCDGYFLNDLDIDTLYNLKINLADNTANCYIESSQKAPTMPKGLREKLNNSVITDFKDKIPKN